MTFQIKRRIHSTMAIIALILLSSHPAFATDTVVYTYDDLNRLKLVDYGNGYVIENVYDEVGNRQAGKVMHNPHTLTVSRSGTGANWGTVTASLPSVSCGTKCADLYSEGDVVTLTASTTASDTFTGWTGCASSSGNTCTVNMSTDANVTANFECPSRPVKIGGSYYWTVHEAYAASGSGLIQTKNATITDNLTTGNATSVTLYGGYDECYSAKTGYTTLQGTITTNAGVLTVQDVIMTQ